MGRYFGTDGFRGEYGRDLTDAHAELIGRFLGEFYKDCFRENEIAEIQKVDKIYGGENDNGAEKEVTKIRKSKIKRARILIGRDTRASSDLLEAALVRGIRAAGGEAILLGICTTPAVAFLVKEPRIYAPFFDENCENSTSDLADFEVKYENFSSDLENFGADAAVMITASHNPWRDNGIKILDRRGLKIDDKIIEKIEDFIS